MNGRKRTQENLSKFAYVLVEKSQESIPDYYFPLIQIFFAFGIYSFKTLEHQSGISEVSEERGVDGMRWDVMLFAKYYIFIFLNFFVSTSQLRVLL